MSEEKRIGIMGGTFNPIHIGHLILAQKAYEEYNLDKIIFITSGDPPHKEVSNHVGSSDRSEMTKLAIADNPNFEHSDIEMRREGHSYTYLTLMELKKIYADAKLYFILGADSLFYLESWRKPEMVMKNAVLLAANRNTSDDELIAKINDLQEDYECDIRIIHMPNIDISSSSIRQMIVEHKSVKYYVTNEVNDYIKKNGLYTGDN